MTLTLITAPATEPVRLAEAKAHCRVEHTADDTFITSLIVAARMAAEHELQRPLITQTWQAAYEAFPSEIWGINAIALGNSDLSPSPASPILINVASPTRAEPRWHAVVARLVYERQAPEGGQSHA